ncbi:MAG: hypothetical protein V4695_04705 [Pseudomonadota bacterium]
MATSRVLLEKLGAVTLGVRLEVLVQSSLQMMQEMSLPNSDA